jgi:release factor glutamine methyltransferase
MIKEALHQASRTLDSSCVEDAYLEAELLLMHLLDIDRAQLYVRLEEELSPRDAEALGQLLERRLCHEPIPYILGHSEFLGHDFRVGPGVLIPRAETELLVEEALALARSEFPHQDPTIADVGTGCGAIAVSLALLLPRAGIYATDISGHALDIARVNCDKHGIRDRVQLLQGDLTDPLPEPVDIIIANLPYVRDEELGQLSAEIRMFEPLSALAGGGDGLDKVRQLLSKAGERLRPGGYIILEIGAGQGEVVASVARSLFPRAVVQLATDLGGIDRVISVAT